MITWWRRNWLGYFPTLQLVLCPIVGVGSTYLIWKWGLYTVFKVYPAGFGAGFNLYWRGWRIVGIDWHQWIMRQDVKTGKPLQPHEQYALNRPHIDLPLWEYHHWPWAQLPHSSEVAVVTAIKKERRAAKAEKKAEKKARREAVLQARGTKITNPKEIENQESSPSDAISEPTNDLNLLSTLASDESTDRSIISASCPPTPLESLGNSPISTPTVPHHVHPHSSHLSPLLESSSEASKRIAHDHTPKTDDTLHQPSSSAFDTENPVKDETLDVQSVGEPLIEDETLG